MKLLSPTTALLLAAAGGAALVSTGAISTASASPTAGTVTVRNAADTSTATPAPATPKAHKRGALSGRGLHADFVVRGTAGTFITAASQRGDVTAVSPTSITLKSDDGFTRTYAILPTTKLTSDRAPVTVDTLKTGEKAALVAVKNGDVYDARHIALPKS